ncbi:hypothetical protein Ga0466249_004998 [Sporomusaceae bacterium BoRhaA]|nr:hypothetical protein [Pelorhabdus rhamnosifermentans]
MGLKFLINLGLPGCNDLVLFRYSMGSPFLFVSIKAFVISYDSEVIGGLCEKRRSANN